MIAGHVDATFTGSPALLPHIRSGRLRALAVSNAALKRPEVAKQLATEGAVALGGTPQAFGALIAREIPRWCEVVKTSGMKMD